MVAWNSVSYTHLDVYKRQHSSFMITMTARFFSQKDQPTLIRALSLLPSDIHVVFVGSGESIFECKALATELGLSERIHFLGRRTDVNRILKTSDSVSYTHLYDN